MLRSLNDFELSSNKTNNDQQNVGYNLEVNENSNLNDVLPKFVAFEN